ncbi:MAG: 4'-phosphopantetheinyl transferase family protein [Methylococcaceae bacterium]
MSSLFVDLWYGDLLSEQMTEQRYWPLLNAEEKHKATAFSRKNVQQKYIKTRGILRQVLASYLNIDAQKVIIKTGEYGKPYLVENGLYFNLSHTDNKIVVVVSNGGEVGVDVEYIRDRQHMSGLVKKCFSKIESSYWNALPEDQKITMFYHFWVRKEAFVKAVGRGIALGLNQCVVNPDDQTRFLTIPSEYGLSVGWKILEAVLIQDYICAIVTKDMEFEYTQTELN